MSPMKTSGMIILSVAVAIGLGGLVASLNLSPTKRQSLRIYRPRPETGSA
jgi:hypothetical protein